MSFQQSKDLQKVDKHWSKTDLIEDDANFYLSPLTRQYIIETAYGKALAAKHRNNRFSALDIFIENYLKDRNIKSILSLCCGFGLIERRFVSQLPAVTQCLGLDVAEGALLKARERAAEESMHCITYERADLNDYRWEKEKYDLVIANGALHHIKNLEGVIAGIRDTLKPGGILYSSEYVGPAYMNHSVRQLQIINAASFLVPYELRARRGVPLALSSNPNVFRAISGLQSAAAKREDPEWPRWKKFAAKAVKALNLRNPDKLEFGIVHVSPKKWLLKSDPSECVRSAEIIPLLKSTFPDVEIRPFGGGILQHALDENYYVNFDADNPLHTKNFAMLCNLEKHFMDTGEIGMENAFIVARK